MGHLNRQSRHRAFQFSLKSLFLVMLVVAAYFAGYGTTIREAQQLRRKVERGWAAVQRAHELEQQLAQSKEENVRWARESERLAKEYEVARRFFETRIQYLERATTEHNDRVQQQRTDSAPTIVAQPLEVRKP
jgi:hypothetical protein